MTSVAEALEQERQLEELINKVRFVEYSSEEEAAIIQWILKQESKDNGQN